MRSIFSKLLIWSIGTFALSLLAYWAIAHALERRVPPEGDPFRSMIELVEDDVCRSYEEGGARAWRATCAGSTRRCRASTCSRTPAATT